MTSESTAPEEIDLRQNSPVVVVADDDRDNLDFISFILDALSLKYYLADNGETALSLVKHKLPDLVLLDVVMPKMNGIEVVVYLKANPLTSHIPTVAITGLAEQEHLLAIESAGFDDYLVKPFLIEDLEVRLKTLLEVN